MRSSLKTWLNGENPFVSSPRVGLLNSTLICSPQIVAKEDLIKIGEQALQTIPGFACPWYCDVLDDGTAITYYAFEDS